VYHGRRLSKPSGIGNSPHLGRMGQPLHIFMSSNIFLFIIPYFCTLLIFIRLVALPPSCIDCSYCLPSLDETGLRNTALRSTQLWKQGGLPHIGQTPTVDHGNHRHAVICIGIFQIRSFAIRQQSFVLQQRWTSPYSKSTTLQQSLWITPRAPPAYDLRLRDNTVTILLFFIPLSVFHTTRSLAEKQAQHTPKIKSSTN
jgi:hypothetical protein